MKTPNTILRKRIFEKLQGISLFGRDVPVFDLLASPEALKPYIIIASSNVIPDDINKSTVSYQCVVSIDINTESYGAADVDMITNEATQALDTINYDLGASFQLIRVGIDSINTLPTDLFETSQVARNVLIMRYTINEH